MPVWYSAQSAAVCAQLVAACAKLFYIAPNLTGCLSPPVFMLGMDNQNCGFQPLSHLVAMQDEDGKILLKFPEPMKGFRDFLYFDEQLQISIGNRGSLTIIQQEA